MSLLSHISSKVKKQMLDDPFFATCAFKHMHVCGGRVTWEHALIFGGKRMNVFGSIIPCCEKAHGVLRYQDSKEEIPKEMRVWVALNIIDMDMLKKEYPRQDWEQKLKYLNSKYGEYRVRKIV